jgi:hypothetical protein
MIDTYLEGLPRSLLAVLFGAVAIADAVSSQQTEFLCLFECKCQLDQLVWCGLACIWIIIALCLHNKMYGNS